MFLVYHHKLASYPFSTDSPQEEKLEDDVRIEDMTPEQLGSALTGGATQEEGANPDDEASQEKSPEETTEESGAEELNEEEKSEEASVEETTSNDENESDDETAEGGEEDDEREDDITHDPLKDTQRKLTKMGQENARLRREMLELEQKLLQSKEPKAPKEYSANELEEMRVYEPEKYKQVIKEREEFDQQRQAHERQVQENKDALDAEFDIEVLQKTTDAIVTVASEVLGLENADAFMGRSFDQLPKEVQDFYDSAEFQSLISKAEGSRERYFETDGSITAETIRDLWRIVTYDKQIEQAKLKGRQQSTQKIKEAARSGSKLNKIPNTNPGKSRAKEIDELSDAEIHGMNAEQLRNYASEL